MKKYTITPINAGNLYPQVHFMTALSNCLLILTPGFPKDESDTTCLPFLQNLVEELNEEFPKLNLVIMAFDYPFIAAPYKWKGNEVISFNGWKKRKLKKLYKWLLIWKRIGKVKRNNNIIGILSLWCGECAILGSRFAKRSNLSHYCWIQGQDAKKGNKYVSMIKPASEEMIAISDFNQMEFEINHGIKPGHVIPVGIRPGEYSEEYVIKENDILGVGSLIPLKQYHLFIEIIYEIKPFFPDIKAVLCGKGPEESKLRTLIEHYNLQENITLAGELSHDKILTIMKRSKVFLHTSNYEGLSVACLEALGSGCRVISFLRPMLHEIEHWCVFQTKEEMIEKAISILNDASLIYRPVFPFTAKESVKSLLRLYNYNDSTIF
jgi:glycosyltransferase involved in cell wall biosynthesis